MILLSSIQERLTRKKTTKKIVSHLILITTINTLAIGSITGVVVKADKYDDQINFLKRQNSQNITAQQSLDAKEGDLNKAVENSRANINAIETQIADNQAKNTALEQKIADSEKEIVKQKGLLKTNIKQMYLDGQISTVEKLASSKNLSDYTDKEQYRMVLQNKVKNAMDRITALKSEQEEEKVVIQKLLIDQKTMQAQIAAQKAENDRLLQLNLGQQTAYSQDVQQNNSKISKLRQQQIAENNRGFIGNVKYGSGGGYPYAGAPFPNSISDPWGMYQRQCVSYTAWKVAASGRHMPYWGGRGNANQWDDNARAAGIAVDYSPRVGDVAVSNSGYYGHVMYVQAVNGDGTIYISQYNAGWDGRYSEGTRSISGLVFIHF